MIERVFLIRISVTILSSKQQKHFHYISLTNAKAPNPSSILPSLSLTLSLWFSLYFFFPLHPPHLIITKIEWRRQLPRKSIFPWDIGNVNTAWHAHQMGWDLGHRVSQQFPRWNSPARGSWHPWGSDMKGRLKDGRAKAPDVPNHGERASGEDRVSWVPGPGPGCRDPVLQGERRSRIPFPNGDWTWCVV